MLSWFLAAVLIILGCRAAKGQNKDICNFDPDVIFFDNDELEKLRKSYTFGGECSPVVLKSGIDDLVETNNRNGGDIGELSVRDQQRLNMLKSESVSRKHRHFETKPLFQNSEPFQRILQPGYKTNGQFIFKHDQRKPLDNSPRHYLRPFGNPHLTEDFFGRHHNQDGFLSMDERKRRQGQESKRPLFVPELGSMLPPGEDNFGNGVRPSSPGSSRRRTTSRPASFGRPNDFRPSMFGLPAEQLSTPTEFGTNDFLRPGPITLSPQTLQTSSPSPTDETTTMPGPPPWATPPSVCVQRCPNTPEYNPVCGSDRITYNNPGRLRCEQQCGKANVELRFFGVCRERSVLDTGLLNRA